MLPSGAFCTSLNLGAFYVCRRGFPLCGNDDVVLAGVGGGGPGMAVYQAIVIVMMVVVVGGVLMALLGLAGAVPAAGLGAGGMAVLRGEFLGCAHSVGSLCEAAMGELFTFGP